MLSIALEIQLVAVVVAVACALPGVFLVLRRMSLMSDAISHTVLLGIVLAFFLTRNMASPLLMLGAAATGVLTVALVEALRRTGLVREDTSIGLVFPALFSIAVLLIARYAGNVHLDTDAVLLGEIAFAPFRRLEVGGIDLGPRTLYVMGGILVLELVVIVAFYKELKLSTFDPALAAALGFSPVLLHYAFMGLVSITAVGAFDAVGSILVVALMIAPPAAAYLLSDRLAVVLLLSAGLAAVAALGGFWIAWWVDASIAGCMAAAAGVIFMTALLFGRERGLLALAHRRRRQRVDFAQLMLTIHLLQHEGTAAAVPESRESHLGEHLRWTPEFARRVVRGAAREGWIERGADGVLRLTPRGRAAAVRTLGETSPGTNGGRMEWQEA
ncbi:MAG TPA: metal ABC transporter permease [Longimicrobiales bacterium]|nr:metal ABC transporter permease [Longimicrobiales bacterium]